MGEEWRRNGKRNGNFLPSHHLAFFGKKKQGPSSNQDKKGEREKDWKVHFPWSSGKSADAAVGGRGAFLRGGRGGRPAKALMAFFTFPTGLLNLRA